tara:strand:- start:281 stop:574 length:294 start_codon:yes stop_codon:yes gene_type:complete
MKDLQTELESVILSVGDLIVDETTGFVGLLIKRERRIDMIYDDMFFWHIKWIKNIDRRGEDPTTVPLTNLIEEEGMKLSIVVGMLTLYQASKGEHEF